jgi:hypothetical protein
VDAGAVASVVCVDVDGVVAGDEDGDDFGGSEDAVGVDGAVVSSDGGGAGVLAVSEPEPLPVPDPDPEPEELLCERCDDDPEPFDPDDEPLLPLLPIDSSQLIGWNASACLRNCHCVSINE